MNAVVKVHGRAFSKSGLRREEYRDQQDQVLASSASLVEIDLLRRGQERGDAGGVVVAPPGELLTLPRFDYLACVSRAGDRAQVEVYAVTLRERLPRVAIPLREPDADVVLDLPAIFAQSSDNGAYAVRVDYDQPPPEPFRPDDEAWAQERGGGASWREAIAPGAGPRDAGGLLRDAGLRGQNGGGDSEGAGGPQRGPGPGPGREAGHGA